jgi:hypothetical protein
MGEIGLDKPPGEAGFHGNVGADDKGEKLAWTSCPRQGGFHANGVDVEWEKLASCPSEVDSYGHDAGLNSTSCGFKWTRH